MGKADKHIRRTQEMINRSSIFKPYESTSKFMGRSIWTYGLDNQGKLARDMMKRGK